MDSNKLPYRLLSGCDMDKLTIIDYPGRKPGSSRLLSGCDMDKLTIIDYPGRKNQIHPDLIWLLIWAPL